MRTEPLTGGIEEAELVIERFLHVLRRFPISDGKFLQISGRQTHVRFQVFESLVDAETRQHGAMEKIQLYKRLNQKVITTQQTKKSVNRFRD